MKEIDLVKTPQGLRGWTEEDQAEWAKVKGRIEGLEPGEYCRIGFSQPRNLQFHRKFFAMLGVGFDAWEPKRKTYRGAPVQKNRERFRKDMLIAAGFYEVAATAAGGVKLEAKSISFAAMDDQQFEEVYSAVAQVLLERVLANYSRADLDAVVERLMKFTE